jgi:hypothetical protein
MRKLSQLALVLGLVSACRGGGGGGDDDPGVDGSVGGEDVRIQDIQNDAMPTETPVAMKGVVVVAIDGYGFTGDLYVAEPEGGPFSGIKIFSPPVDQISALKPGDLVDVTGVIKREACLAANPCGSVTFMEGETPTQLVAAATGSINIKKVGTGTVPTPALVDAKAIAELSSEERTAEWEKWEGVLVKIVNARQLNDVKPFGSNPGPDQTEFRITGVARVQSKLVELPGTAVVGTCYESITGIGDWFFNYYFMPRTADDLVAGGNDCNPMVDSIKALQEASTEPELVKLTDVYVSAVAYNKKNLWVSSSMAAGPDTGVYVFRGTGMSTTALPTDVVAGAKVTIYGSGAEFDGQNGGDTLTQVTSPSINVMAPPSGQVAAVTGKTVSELLVPSTGEAYEGVLVTLTNVKVTTVGTMGNNFISDLAQYPGNVAFKADNDIYQVVAGDANKCFASITGIWTYNAFDDQYQFLPRAVGTGTGTCN